MHIIFEIVNILKELASSDQDRRELTTSDIRVAVVQAIRDLVHTGEYSNESVGMWSAAYVRRYGDPANQFIKVIDNDQEYDLNFEYINKTLLPHLLNRIMGLPKNSAPFETYRRIFSRDIVTDMSKEILSSLNSLNLYAIRYKTILYLLQDLILEPPHPWIVNEETIEKVVSYNMTMANTHLERTLNPKSTFNLEAIHQSFHEYFRHICAAILANYGAFLGTGGRYGLLELKRILGLRQTNLVLWQYCQIKNLEADLLKENSDVTALANCLTRVIAHLSYPATESKHFEDLREHASYLLRIASHICEKRI